MSNQILSMYNNNKFYNPNLKTYNYASNTMMFPLVDLFTLWKQLYRQDRFFTEQPLCPVL